MQNEEEKWIAEEKVKKEVQRIDEFKRVMAEEAQIEEYKRLQVRACVSVCVSPFE